MFKSKYINLLGIFLRNSQIIVILRRS